jgi:hypothetical protein
MKLTCEYLISALYSISEVFPKPSVKIKDQAAALKKAGKSGLFYNRPIPT